MIARSLVVAVVIVAEGRSRHAVVRGGVKEATARTCFVALSLL